MTANQPARDPSSHQGPSAINAGEDDRYSLVLLLSLLFFLILSAFVRDNWISEVLLVLSMYAVLILAILKSSGKRHLPWPALVLTACSMLVTLVCVYFPIHTLRIANWLLLSLFFGYVSVTLFQFLERSSVIVRAKLLACLGLYLILGMFFYAVFNLLQEIHPGSFVELTPAPTPASRHSLLYLSISALTTVGFGDVLPVSRPARMIAVLESITGVFYVAVTVARLVSAYQQRDHS